MKWKDRERITKQRSPICRAWIGKLLTNSLEKSRPNFSPLESDLNLIEAWEGYCKDQQCLTKV